MFNIALRNTARSVMTAQSRRASSSTGTSTTFLTADKQYSVRKAWLSDPSTYPIITVLVAAGALCTGFGTYFIVNSKDVRISPQKRNSILRAKE
mmetsp:Transcript_26059/g.30267  ORF Transcript_26059/g.30267 Transcript_26059/m.30267 type:complete len:94 (+) Transcript_26059:88-369(+)